MLVRIVKPAPEGVYLTPRDCVVVNEGGRVTVDYIAEAEKVKDGVVEFYVKGEKVGEQPNFRDPTDDELRARHPSAVYISRWEANTGAVTEVKKEAGLELKHNFSGWGVK